MVEVAGGGLALHRYSVILGRMIVKSRDGARERGEGSLEES
jgi:hypothetical protein